MPPPERLFPPTGAARRSSQHHVASVAPIESGWQRPRGGTRPGQEPGWAAWLAGCMLLVALLALAPLPPAAAQTVDDAVQRIARQLQCPVCEGQTVADSNSGLARDMRSVIREKLQAGESERQILDYFVARYGDGILSEPPKRGLGLGVWLGPIVAVGLGAALLAAFAVALLRRAPTASAPAAPPEVSAVSEELARFRELYGR